MPDQAQVPMPDLLLARAEDLTQDRTLPPPVPNETTSPSENRSTSRTRVVMAHPTERNPRGPLSKVKETQLPEPLTIINLHPRDPSHSTQQQTGGHLISPVGTDLYHPYTVHERNALHLFMTRPTEPPNNRRYDSLRPTRVLSPLFLSFPIIRIS
jgi:hypothetical protein